MKLKITLALLLLTTVVFSQQVFQKKYGNFDGSRVYSVELTNDSGYVFLGSYDVAGILTAEFYVIKTDAKGDTLWAKTYGAKIDSTAVTTRDGSGNEGYDVIQTKDSGYFLLGEAHGFIGTGSSDVYAIKLDKQGDLVWSKTYGGAIGSDYGYKAIQLPDNGYILTGFTESYGLGVRDTYVIRINSIGDTLWTRVFGGPSIDASEEIIQTKDKGFVFVGNTYSYGAGGSDVQLTKIDSTGTIIWEKSYGGTQNDFGESVVELPDSGFMLTGSTQSFGAGQKDVYVIRTNSMGNLLWSKTYGGTGNEGAKSIVRTSDGHCILAGDTRSFGQGAEDAYVLKINLMGDTLWTYTYGGTSIDYAESIRETIDKGFIIGGYTNSFMTFNYDVYAIKLDSLGNSDCTRKSTNTIISNPATLTANTSYSVSHGGIVTTVPTIKGKTRITVDDACQLTSIINNTEKKELYVYPNPTNNWITIQYKSSLIEGNYSVELMNLEGKQIQTFSVTNASNQIDVSGIQKGIYLIKVETKEGFFTQKLIKL